MSAEPSVLVVGAGSSGSRHARNLSELGARVTAMDLDEQRAAAAPATEAIPFDLGRVRDFNGVVIATPTALHREQAMAALGGGAAVLVEKPLTASEEDLDDLVDAAGDRLAVGYNLRLHRPVERLRELLLAGRAGRLIQVHAWFGSYLPDWRPGVDYRGTYSARAAEGGGVLRDASHELDLLVWFLGPNWSVEGAVTAHRSDLEIDVEDVATALLRSADGVPAVVSLDYVSRRYRRGLELVGEDATLRLDWASGTLEIDEPGGTEVEEAGESVDESYRREAAAFLELVAGREGPVVSATEGAASVRLVARIEEAARAG
jgi:predicted dehydrogenase